MATDRKRWRGWLERRKAAKRAKAERTGDTPEKARERAAGPDAGDPGGVPDAGITTNVTSGSGGF